MIRRIKDGELPAPQQHKTYCRRLINLTLGRLLLCMLALVMAIPAGAANLAQQADSAYNKKDFALAVELYTQSLARDGVSPVIYYNLGNAYYRTGNLGKAIINYERALKLDPSMTEARDNLSFVRTKIVDKPEDDSTFFENVHTSILSSFSPEAWAWISLALFALLMGAVALYIFSGNIALRKTGFFGGIVVLVLLIYSITIAAETASAAPSDGAVVIVPTTNLTSAPGTGASDDKVVPIHEGTKVQIVDSLPTPDDPESKMWYDVKINNTTRAWLHATDVERI